MNGESGELSFEAPLARKTIAIHFRSRAPRIIYYNLGKTIEVKQSEGLVLIRTSGKQDLSVIQGMLEAHQGKEFHEMVALCRSSFDDYQVLLITGKEHQTALAIFDGVFISIESILYLALLGFLAYLLYY